jgi:hypothetical protein
LVRARCGSDATVGMPPLSILGYIQSSLYVTCG